jgi:hypothetical protein
VKKAWSVFAYCEVHSCLFCLRRSTGGPQHTCVVHTCQRFRCLLPNESQATPFCSECRCDALGCTRPHAPQTRLCDDCVCDIDGCVDQCIFGSRCRRHRPCIHARCSLPRQSESDACASCTQLEGGLDAVD